MISRKNRRGESGRSGRVVLLLAAACLLPLALGRAAIAVLPASGSDAPDTSVDGATEASAQSSTDKLQEMWEELGCQDPVEGRQIVEGLTRRERPVPGQDAPAVVFWGNYAYEDMYRFTFKRKDGLEVTSPRRRLTPPNGTVGEKYFREIGLDHNTVRCWRG